MSDISKIPKLGGKIQYVNFNKNLKECFWWKNINCKFVEINLKTQTESFLWSAK